MKLIIAIIHKEHLFLNLIYHVMLFTWRGRIYTVCVCVSVPGCVAVCKLTQSMWEVVGVSVVGILFLTAVYYYTVSGMDD